MGRFGKLLFLKRPFPPFCSIPKEILEKGPMFIRGLNFRGGFLPWTFFLLSLCAILSTISSASDLPLTQDQLKQLILGHQHRKVSEDRVLYLIAERGLSFDVDASFVNSLKHIGATRLILDAVKANGRARSPRIPSNKTSESAPAPITPKPSSGAPTRESGTATPGPLIQEDRQAKPVAEKTTHPSSASQLAWDGFLEEVRQSALQHTEDLPNFICAQVTRRYLDASGSNRWQSQDTLQAELTYNQKKENYANVLVNGRPSNRPFEALGGTLSIGEFGSILRALFMPQSQATFWKEREEDLRGLRTLVIGFTVPQSTSSWTLSFENSHSLKVAYRGNVWVDPQKKQVMKISQSTTQIPATFPISYAETTTEYGNSLIQGIEGKEFLLPLRAELIMRESRQHSSTRNVIEFREFRKFTSDVKLVSDRDN
jgi:hypothetical protein